jgi:hypothetical protein
VHDVKGELIALLVERQNNAEFAANRFTNPLQNFAETING